MFPPLLLWTFLVMFGDRSGHLGDISWAYWDLPFFVSYLQPVEDIPVLPCVLAFFIQRIRSAFGFSILGH